MEESKHKFSSALITAVYAVFTLIFVHFHEIWADEAQVWMLVKYISLPDLFQHLVNEGHPPFFYLVVMPFAKLFDNIVWMQLICWIASVLAVFLLWNNSKFNNLTKTVITLSAPFIYFFPTVARSYSIIPLFVFLLAIFHNKTKEHPFIYTFLIVALTHTHVIMAMFCFLLFVRFLYINIYLKYKNKEKLDKKFILAACFMFLGFVGLFLQLVGTTASNNEINFRNNDYLGSITRVFGLFIFNSFDSFLIKAKGLQINIYTIIMTLSILLAWLFANIQIFKTDKRIFSFMFLSIFFQFLIYIFAYAHHIYPTRIYIVHTIFIFCCWIVLNENNKKMLNFALVFLFLLTFINSFKNCYGDILFDYSPAYKFSKCIKQNVDFNNSSIYIDNPNGAISLIYYISPNEIINIYDNKPIKYIFWGNYPLLDISYWKEIFLEKRRSGNEKNLYVLVNNDQTQNFSNNPKINNDFEKICNTGISLVANETLTLYKFKEKK